VSDRRVLKLLGQWLKAGVMEEGQWRATEIGSPQKEAERALEMVRWIMGRLKLTLHPTKTHLVDLGREGFEFLGFHFHKRMVPKTGKLLPYFWPGQKTMKAVRSKILQIAGYSRKRLPMERIVSELNPVVRGWRNYFSVGNSTKQLKALDH
jgi:RNA-directed DNA polymerase